MLSNQDTGRPLNPTGIERSSIVRDLLLLAPHTEVVHHIPGRIRLRLKKSGLSVIHRIDVDELMRSIPGIHKLRINPVVGSLTLEYDQKKLPFALWEKLGLIRERPELRASVEEILHGLWQ